MLVDGPFGETLFVQGINKLIGQHFGTGFERRTMLFPGSECCYVLVYALEFEIAHNDFRHSGFSLSHTTYSLMRLTLSSQFRFTMQHWGQHDALGQSIQVI
jgi:hypothetical protein